MRGLSESQAVVNAPRTPPSPNGASSLSERELDLIDRYWRAANYLSVGQIYLLDNPLLREPLSLAQIKPRLLGHWAPRLA